MQDNDAGKTEREPRDEAERNVGRVLQAARTAQGLTIDEISAELRIEPRALRALEECRFDAVGPPVFAKGYLKQYGHRLGLDYDDLLAGYYRLVEPRDVTIEPSPTIKLRDERQITIWLVAALAIVLLGVYLWIWWSEESPPIAPIATPVVDPGVPEADSGDTEIEALDPAAGREGAPDIRGGAQADAEPPPAPADSPGTAPPADAARGDAAGAAAASEPAGAAQAPTDAAAEPFAPPAGPTVALEIEFLEDCWAEVTDARGRSLLYGLGRAGERSTLAGVPPVDLFLGNAGGVRISVEGRPFQVPPGVRRGNLARFSIDAPAE